MSPSFRERQQQVREKEILAAAFELLQTRGYAAMTMDEVAKAVGISKATLYQHFRSKEELAVSVAVSVLKQAEDHFQGLDPALPAVERIRGAMSWIIELRCRAEMQSQPHPAGGFFPALRTAIWHHPRFQVQKERIIQFLTGLVEAGKAEGSVRPDVPTRVLVQAMLALMRDFDYDELLASVPVLPEDLSAYLVAVFLNGVRAR
jgi:AcrR family transcriptional regulator